MLGQKESKKDCLKSKQKGQIKQKRICRKIKSKENILKEKNILDQKCIEIRKYRILAEGPESGKIKIKNVQPNRSSCFAGYRQHIYECLVLLYR